MKQMKRLVSLSLALALLLAAICSISAAATGEDLRFSDEYKTSPYYQNLIQALEENENAPMMERTLAVALSQEGYLNYATAGVDLDQARADGLLWTGKELRMSADETGNTEYTRWAQQYLMNRGEDSGYADYDWCAIFVSWCLYQAGYYSDETLKKYFYSYDADPRIFYDADSWIMSYNLDQQKVWYVPKAHHKLDAMDWNTYYHVDVDPFDIPYRPGGLVFFSWDTSGKYFNHVAIVKSYDPETHVLTYSNGNSGGQVITREIDLDVEESFRGTTFAKNSERIMAYAEYDQFKPLEKKEITTETPTIFWDKNATSGIKIKTDSASFIVSVSEGETQLSNNITGNMLLHEGLVSIGKSEIKDLSVGKHTLTLSFDDGDLDVTLNVTDREHPLLGDVDLDNQVTITDATVIQRYLAQLDNEVFIEKAADIDRDGRITVMDATFIQCWLSELPCPEGIGETVE